MEFSVFSFRFSVGPANFAPLTENGKLKTENSLLALVGLSGLEPLTLRLSSACSNQLSYRPIDVPG